MTENIALLGEITATTNQEIEILRLHLRREFLHALGHWASHLTSLNLSLLYY